MTSKISAANVIFRIVVLASATFLVSTSGTLQAQNQSVPTDQQQPSQNQQAQNQGSENTRLGNTTSGNSGSGNQGSNNQPGFSQQLIRETREAAGEDKAAQDDKTGFKMSPSVSWIAKKLGISTEAASFLSFLFNFLVTAGIIVWACGKYLPGVFSSRTSTIQKAMQEAQKASEEARRKLAEIESRLKKLDVEIGTMRDNAEKEADAEEARIQAATQEDARKITESAREEIQAAAQAARRALTAYAADLAVGLAQKQIRVDAATDQVLIRNFAGQLGTSSSELERKSGKDRN
jgi:F-type H+-transporting ATPase subunit b